MSASETQGVECGLTVLVADDAASDLLILSAILTRVGHRVVPANDGHQAVEQYKLYRPDIVILDVVMPGLDGFETARAIKSLAGDEFVPIIFLTSLTDTPSLVKGLNAGGDDFLSKPYNHIVLNSKINALNRLRELQKTVIEQKNVIQQHNERLLLEQYIAKDVFDKIAHTGFLDARYIRYSLSSMSIFNGDILVSAKRPNGNLVMLLGDFTGHGLSAAIGAMPLASTFYAMIPKGFGLSDILFEINRKLKSILPVSSFCCAILIEINFRKKELNYWNGGLPAAAVFNAHEKTLRLLESSYLPLGVLENRQLKTKTQCVGLGSQDKIYLWTDGIHEATNSAGEMYGESELWDVLNQSDEGGDIFEGLCAGVNQFTQKRVTDDVSLVEIDIARGVEVNALSVNRKASESKRDISFWQSSLNIDHTSFSDVDPLSIMVNGLMEFKNLRNHQAEVFAIASELYVNALEHGVLGLDSEIKLQDEGFKNYYELKQQRLSLLSSGDIKISFSVKIVGSLGELKISVKDSGNGFDASKILLNLKRTTQSSRRYSGRGLLMVHSLCHSVEFIGKGNIVEATFLWSLDD